MGKRVLAAFGVVAPMDGVLAVEEVAASAEWSAADRPAAERTSSSAKTQWQALYRQAVADGGRGRAISPTITLHPRKHA